MSQRSAWELLTNAGERSRLRPTGPTRAALRPRGPGRGLCGSRPKNRNRAGKLVHGAGRWNVFDSRSGIVYSPGLPEVRSQARALAACRESAACDCRLLAATPRIDPLACSARR